MMNNNANHRFMHCVAALLLFFLAFPAGTGRAAQPDVLSRIESTVARGEITRVEVYFVNYEILTFAGVTPQTLPNYADSHQVTDLSGDLRDSFLKAIRLTKIEPLNDSSDLRWGILLINKSGEVSHSIYLNGRYFIIGAGRSGYIDGVSYSFNSTLVDWCEANFFKEQQCDWFCLFSRLWRR